MYNINSNNYKNLTTNKDVRVINLYEELEKYILSIDKKIIRNYIHKGIVFKYKRRILEVLIKQQKHSSLPKRVNMNGVNPN